MAPRFAKHPDRPAFARAFEPYVASRKINPHCGWEIYEQGIYHIAQNIKEKLWQYRVDMTENGMGVEGEDKFRVNGMIQDDYRIDFCRSASS